MPNLTSWPVRKRPLLYCEQKKGSHLSVAGAFCLVPTNSSSPLTLVNCSTIAGSDPHYKGRTACQTWPVKLAHYMHWLGVKLCSDKQWNRAEAAVTGSFKPMSCYFDADMAYLESKGRLEEEKHSKSLFFCLLERTQNLIIILHGNCCATRKR